MRGAEQVRQVGACRGRHDHVVCASRQAQVVQPRISVRAVRSIREHLAVGAVEGEGGRASCRDTQAELPQSRRIVFRHGPGVVVHGPRQVTAHAKGTTQGTRRRRVIVGFEVGGRRQRGRRLDRDAISELRRRTTPDREPTGDAQDVSTSRQHHIREHARRRVLGAGVDAHQLGAGIERRTLGRGDREHVDAGDRPGDPAHAERPRQQAVGRTYLPEHEILVVVRQGARRAQRPGDRSRCLERVVGLGLVDAGSVLRSHPNSGIGADQRGRGQHASDGQGHGSGSSPSHR